NQKAHGRPLRLILLDRQGELVAQLVAERVLELLEVLDGVLALPERAFPLLRGHVAVAGNPPPVRLHVRPLEGVRKGLAGRLRTLALKRGSGVGGILGRVRGPGMRRRLIDGTFHASHPYRIRDRLAGFMGWARPPAW